MKKTSRLCETIAGLVLCLLAVQAHGNSIFLSIDPSTPVQPGETFQIFINMDFTADPTLGGGFDILFDPLALEFDGYEAADLGDPAFQRDPDVGDGELIGFGFGDFGGLTGPALVGALSFVPLDFIVMTELFVRENSFPVGPFVSAVTFSTQDVGFGGVSLSSPPPIPLPGAVWLLASALGLLGRLTPRRPRKFSAAA